MEGFVSTSTSTSTGNQNQRRWMGKVLQYIWYEMNEKVFRTGQGVAHQLS